MIKTLSLLTGFALMQSASAALLVLDFTLDADTTAAGSGSTFSAVDFGDGRTANYVVTTASGPFSSLAVGLGVDAPTAPNGSGGTQGGRIGLNEDLTVTFSNFTGGLTAGDIVFTGFIGSTVASSGVFTINNEDTFLVNGAALTGTNAGDGVAPTLNFTDVGNDNGGNPQWVFQNLDSGGSVALNASDALVLDLTSDAGSGYRLMGIALDVAAVPEPSSTALLGLGFAGLLLRRRRA